MPDREEDPQYVQNFALYNAPPGTIQKIGTHFYAKPDAGEPARNGPLTDVSWTFRLSFVEVVWGDDKEVGRQSDQCSSYNRRG